MNYQFFDWQCYRYDLWLMRGIGYLRGPDPRPLQPGQYIVVLGAAQSFGRFVDRPYPTWLREELGIRVLNLATSAVAPSYFSSNADIMDIVNKAAACVVQVTAARSCGNSVYENLKTRKNVFQKRSDGPDSPFLNEHDIYPAMWESGRIDEAKALLHESQATWVGETLALLQQIKVPKVLLWLSSRTPEYSPRDNNYNSYTGAFPQLVNRDMLDCVKIEADRYVEVVCSEGLPIPFTNRFTGVEGECFFGTIYRTSHAYYPSAAMNDAAAVALEPVLRELLGDVRPARRGASAHEAMIQSAYQAAAEGCSDPFSLTTAFQAVNSFQFDHGIRGIATGEGELAPHEARCVGALNSDYSGSDDGREAIRFCMIGDGADAVPASLALADGAILWVRNVVSCQPRHDFVVALAARYGLVPAVMFDGHLVMIHESWRKRLHQWLRSLLRERFDPTWQAKGSNYGAFPDVEAYASRRPADYLIDHKALM